MPERIFEKVDYEKNQQTAKKTWNISQDVDESEAAACNKAYYANHIMQMNLLEKLKTDIDVDYLFIQHDKCLPFPCWT